MRLASSRAAALWWGLFAVLCLFIAVVGLETALHFDGPPIDGPFQLYNSLRRIWAGQRGGADFQFFHGLAIPYLHYLQFRLLGGTFMASEVSRQLTSVAVFTIVVVVFLRAFIRDWTRVAAWSAIVTAASIALHLTSLLVAGNSLTGIRSALPTLLPVFLYLQMNRPLRAVLSGVTLGVALASGTEQGIAAVLALVVATMIVAVRSRERRLYAAEAGVSIAVSVVVIVALFTAIGGVDGMRGALTFNFRLVPMDQYWYFGAPPNVFVSSWGAIPRMFVALPRIPFALLAGAAAVGLCGRHLMRSANTADERRQFAVTVLALYGFISCASLLSSYLNLYIQPLLRTLLLLGAVYLDGLFPARDASLGRKPLLGVSRSIVHIAVAALLLMIAVVPSVLGTLLVTTPHVVRDHLIGRVGGVYSGDWPATIVRGQAVFDKHRRPDGSPPTLWSTYAGLLEARNGLFQPSSDYIIHALGPSGRSRYVEDFRRVRPQLVQTVSPTYTQYEPWIESTSWDFYVDVLRNYSVVGETPWSLFWQRQASALAGPQEVWTADLADGATSADLPAAPGTTGIVLLQAELFYRVRNPLRSIPLIGASPRYLVAVDNAAHRNAVTLDPYTESARFPIVAFRGKPVRLRWNAFSLLPGAHIDVSRIRLSLVTVSGANIPWLARLYQREMDRTPDQ